MRGLIIFCLMLGATTSFANTKLQNEMLRVLGSIENSFQTLYAPAGWKAEYDNWSITSAMEVAKQQVINNPEITVKEFHVIVKDFFRSTRDYHVGISFVSTEAARLPLSIRSAEGRYFIVYIDRNKLSNLSFPFNVGDEVITFDGRPIQKVVDEIRATNDEAEELTDQALAELFLTSRSGARAQEVPHGFVELGISRRGTEPVVTHQLAWDYRSETIKYDGLEKASRNELAVQGIGSFVPDYFHQQNTPTSIYGKVMQSLTMVSPMAMSLASSPSDEPVVNPWRIGGKSSYLTNLGGRLWSNAPENYFEAYMFKMDDKIIGYIRIPSYGAGEKESAEFAQIMQHFNLNTDALIIDQINNPGGSVFYLYSLVSMLTDQTMYAPKHHIVLSPEMVLSMQQLLKSTEQVKTNEEVQKLFGGATLDGYLLDVNFLNGVRNYAQFVVSEWETGKMLTSPTHLWGVDRINPHPMVSYTKPVLLLINELDFSGGDFFPAILQDNKRVKIMGTRTAGAGGYVMGGSAVNRLGVGRFSITGSLAKRIDDTTIENLGVQPDIEYHPTVTDLQYGFTEYKKAILDEVKNLVD